jgi:hypothetical protein
MSDSRIVTIRKSETLDPSVLQDAFLFIQAQFGYSVESILRPVNNRLEVHLGVYPDTFPNTIKEYYWIQGGSPGSSPWVALGRLTNGLYFFYIAQCYKTKKTFLDGGHMNLWVSVQFSDLIHYAMDRVFYEKYIEQTKG